MTTDSQQTLDRAEPESGELAIHAENILPIIKQWLYSDKEIFLRELISNSTDAITKRKHVSVTRSDVAADGPARVEVLVDAAAGTLTIRDNGIGMTGAEVKQYINQIAFSGAKEFLSQYQVQDEKAQIIGHFGLGFYSAFMVADKVEIHTKSAVDAAAPAVHWTCDGGMSFTMDASPRTEAGTDIVLTLSEDAKDYLNAGTLKTTITKYCNFLPVEIMLEGEVINEQQPLWTKSPTSLKDEDYLAFYRNHFPGHADPILWVHLNVDYPFRLQGILYFPRIEHELSAADGQIQLYCNQVYVSSTSQDLIPKFLTVLQGMIDCPDIPLNVSRSMLQNDPYVRKISNHIAKKVGDRLKAMYNTEREAYEAAWEAIHVFVKFGIMDDDRFADVAKDIVIFKSTNGGYATLDDYLTRNKDKHENVVYYCSDPERQASYLNLFAKQGLEALYLNGQIDSYFISYLERKHHEVKLRSIDAEVNEALLDPDAKAKLVDSENNTTDDRLKELFERHLKGEGDDERPGLEIQIEALRTADVSGLIIEKEEMRRMKEMAAAWKNSGMAFPEMQTFIVNSANPIVQHLVTLADQPGNDEQVKLLTEHLYDLAKVAHKGLEGSEMVTFLERSHKVLSLMMPKT
ncbi:MAG: molecular chaperone HtpG [Candidatus Sericytochromatia bacterium]|nr:molecular chaperone HtpG [Candidatus Sericytochromatia bacterium]